MEKARLFFYTKVIVVFFCQLSLWNVQAQTDGGIIYRRISANEYLDKLKAGWLGQIVGVAWGAPTEFKWQDKIIPLGAVPDWNDSLINTAFNQDDLYVEMTFLKSLEKHGLDVSIRQAGIDFANTEYRLWCANDVGRTNLRAGIAPPDCSHPVFNNCPHDIDYQIEADYSGLIAPGMSQIPVELGEKFGRLMNYSDGVYGGQFVGAMYTEAFFEKDLVKIIESALQCIPYESQYAEMVRDVLAWYKLYPNDWEKTWALCQQKYRENPDYQKFSNGGIDVKINGAYILIGLLYGKGNIEDTIIISMRCGQDSDCNPSNAGGILFTTMGASKLPKKYREGLDEERCFEYTSYNFKKLIEVCEKLARAYILRNGGYIEKASNGEEYFFIPMRKAIPSQLVYSWDAEPIAHSVFTNEEKAQIKFKGYLSLQKAFDDLFPGWKVSNCGNHMSPGYRETYKGRQKVILTHPKNQETPCVLMITQDIPKGKKTFLKVLVTHHDKGDWELVIRVNGAIQRTISVSESSVGVDGWLEVICDLTSFAGTKNARIELENKANGWAWEAAYWGELLIESY